MNSTIIRKHIFDFIEINKRLPVFMAITVEQFQQYKASMYIPGVQGLKLEQFKRIGFYFDYRWKGKHQNVYIIWKDAVIC